MNRCDRHGVQYIGALLVASLGAIAMAGCGGGSSSSASKVADSTHGSIQFRIAFPSRKPTGLRATPGAAKQRSGRAFDGSLPQGTHSVKISLTDSTTGASLAPTRIVSDQQRPDGVTGTITVGYPLIPVGNATIDVTALPSVDATGNALATGSTTAAILANQVTSANVLMSLTLNSLTLLPKSQNLFVLGSGQSSVTVDGLATDAAGNPLLYPLQYSSDMPSLADITAVTPDFMHATVTAFDFTSTPTPVTITVTEPNSGMTATATVIVSGG